MILLPLVRPFRWLSERQAHSPHSVGLARTQEEKL